MTEFTYGLCGSCLDPNAIRKEARGVGFGADSFQIRSNEEPQMVTGESMHIV